MQLTPTAQDILVLVPGLKIPSNNSSQNVNVTIFDIVAANPNVPGIPLLPYISDGCIRSKEIRKLVYSISTQNLPNDIIILCSNILRKVANTYENDVTLMDFLSKIYNIIYPRLIENSSLNNLLYTIYQSPELQNIPFQEIFSQASFRLTNARVASIFTKLAYKRTKFNYIRQSELDVPTVESITESDAPIEYIYRGDMPVQYPNHRQTSAEERRIIETRYTSAIGKIKSYDDIIQENSLFKHIVDQSFIKDNFIQASECWIKSYSGGLSPEQILTLPFVYLTHSTYLESLESILSRGAFLSTAALTSRSDLELAVEEYRAGNERSFREPFVRMDQYPGIYLSTDLPEEPYRNFGLEVIFVLSLSLLKHPGWHINKTSPYWAITEMTWDSYTFTDHLCGHYANGENFDELVMHYPVPLEYVECIVWEDSLIPTLKNIVKNRYIIYSMTEFQGHKPYKRIKGLYQHGPYSDAEPDLCYDNLGSAETIILTNKNIRSTLLNSDYNEEQVNELMRTKSYKELVELLMYLWTEKLLTGKHPIPKVHPPY